MQPHYRCVITNIPKKHNIQILKEIINHKCLYTLQCTLTIFPRSNYEIAYNDILKSYLSESKNTKFQLIAFDINVKKYIFILF